MTYYEEFGIPSSATTDEIRQAHRRLMKILHPDLQIEEGARQLAEIQTRRVNGIAQVLMDCQHREDYDSSLLPVSIYPRLVHRSYALWAFGAAAILCLVLGLWILPTDHAAINSAIGEFSKSQKQPDSGQAITRQASIINAPLEKRKSSNKSRQLVSTEPVPFDQHFSGADQASLDVEPPSIDLAAKPAPENRLEGVQHKPPATLAPSTTENPMIGTWIYVPAPLAEEDRKMYRPEYIEMRIRNVRGVLEGQYRARYQVPDRPLSPNVGFHFAGQPGALSSTFRWNGANGLAGQVELRLMTVNSIQVDWRVTELAESADLVSGTAILTRVQ